MSHCAAYLAERIAGERFADEVQLQTGAERDGWSTTEPHVAAEPHTGGSEPAVQRARCFGGTRDWIESSDGMPDSVAGELH